MATETYAANISHELLNFARYGTNDQTREVIVEADAQLEKAAPPRHLTRTLPPPRSELGPGESPDVRLAIQENENRIMGDLERQIASLHPIDGPDRIPIACAFFVTVNPELLRQIAELPHVSTIRLNREHRSFS